MIPLPRGITGFDAIGKEVSGKSFAKACYAAAQWIGGEVVSVREAERVTPNFHDALITLPRAGKTVWILCNAHYPVIAFAKPPVSEGETRLDFIDCPELEPSVSGEFTVLPREQLEGEVTDEAITQIGSTELRQMRHWRPRRIGDLIFNYWD